MPIGSGIKSSFIKRGGAERFDPPLLDASDRRVDSPMHCKNLNLAGAIYTEPRIA